MTEVQFAKQFLTALDSKNTKYQSDHVFDPETFQMRIPYTLPKLSHPPHPLPPKPAGATTTPAPGSEPLTQDPIPLPTIDITLKSTRNPAFTLHLPSLPPSTPINTLKAQIQSLLSPSGPANPDKIKILHNKKPTPASKFTVHDVLTSDSSTPSLPSTVEFGVMVLGGAPDPDPAVQTVNLDNTVEAGTSTGGDSQIPAPGPGSENATVEASIGVNPEDVMKGLEKTAAAQARDDPTGHAVLDTPEFWDDLQGFLEQRLRDAGEAVRLRGLFERAVKS